MNTQLVVTDITRMYKGMVCIAGYDRNRRCIRPELPPPGISESFLYSGETARIFPFALIELDLLKTTPQPPHTEDCRFDPKTVRYVGTVYSREAVLCWSLFPSVAAIFEQPVLHGPGYYVKACRGVRSLGTIQPGAIKGVEYQPSEEGAFGYRLVFTDGEDAEYNLKIVDLTWNYYCHSLRDEIFEQKIISHKMSKLLRERSVYLRIGLGRSWKAFPDRCYLQITGIYTFPDHLGGKHFAHFAPRRKPNSS